MSFHLDRQDHTGQTPTRSGGSPLATGRCRSRGDDHGGGSGGNDNGGGGTDGNDNGDDGNGNGTGVYGRNDSTNGWGVFAEGRSGASGTKSFRIDHPGNPENEYLLHYSAESPEVINFYRGTVVLDGAGEAVVELPSYFARINKTPSDQLTAIGAPMPMLHVAEEIDEAALRAGADAGPDGDSPDSSFRIAGGVAGAKGSWEVKAARNDRWVQTHGAPVEIEKQDREKGTYRHPELYGLPPEMGMNHQPELERVAPGHPAS